MGEVDWSAPWLAPYADLRADLESADWRGALTRCAREHGVRNASGRPIEFAAADDAPAGTAYEAHIAATGRVPSRDSGHDRFNALIWLAYPRTKAALNARQAQEIARRGVGATRGPVRDAATLIDESGLLLACDDRAACDALADHDWQRALIDDRARWGREIVPLVFGHALLEKLAGPFKAITAAVVPLPLGAGTRAAIDTAAAAFVARAELAPRELLHLPVLGIPGWWPANKDVGFYVDTTIFRPRRRAT